MTISAFVNSRDFHGDPRGGRGVRARYREQKHREAEVRQEAHDADVAQAARDHNISEREARRVVNERRRFQRRLIERMLANPLISEVQP